MTNWLKGLFKKSRNTEIDAQKGFNNYVERMFIKKTYKTSLYLKQEARKFIYSVFPFMCEYCGTGYKSCPQINTCIMCGAPGIIENE